MASDSLLKDEVLAERLNRWRTAITLFSSITSLMADRIEAFKK